MAHNVLKTFAEAQHRFGRLVDAAREDQWSDPTPCEDWSVRDLVTHLVDEQLWAPPLLAGRSVSEIVQPYPGHDPLAGALGAAGDNALADPDPKAAWHAAAHAAHAAFAEPGALERTVHLSYGDRDAAGYCEELTGDVIVHAWDLAKGLGIEPDFDEETLAAVYRQSAPHVDMFVASGLFKPPVSVPDDAPLLDRTIALFGRDPHWQPPSATA